MLQVRCLVHHEVGGGAQFDRHLFTLKVSLGDNDSAYFESFCIDRSYVDFVYLEYSLRKRFPGVERFALPLANADYIENGIISGCYGYSPTDHRRSFMRKQTFKSVHQPHFTDLQDIDEGDLSTISSDLTNETTTRSIFSSSLLKNVTGPLPSIIQKLSQQPKAENMEYCAQDLDFYLQDILSRHELVSSSEFLNFIDPSITAMHEIALQSFSLKQGIQSIEVSRPT